jgi:hypothetical protein
MSASQKPIRLTLDPEQSEILTDAGADAFLVIGRGSWPDNPNRWQLWIVPSTVKQVNAAVRVALVTLSFCQRYLPPSSK